MNYQQETFSIPKISVDGTFRLNIGAIVKRVVVNKLPVVKRAFAVFFSRVVSILSGLATKVRKVLASIFHEVTEITSEKVTSGAVSVRSRLARLGTNLRYNFPRRKFLRIFIVLLLVIALAFIAKAVLSWRSQSSPNKVEVLGAKASQTINKEITFPLRDEKGDELSRISYMVEKVELMDQILVKGQKATAIKGRTFLILTVKIKNDFDKSIEINTKDYVRLKVKGSEEFLAPDIHNDPVTVQAISTKYTKVGFPIYDTDRQVYLQLGEINGGKEVIEINL